MILNGCRHVEGIFPYRTPVHRLPIARLSRPYVLQLLVSLVNDDSTSSLTILLRPGCLTLGIMSRLTTSPLRYAPLRPDTSRLVSSSCRARRTVVESSAVLILLVMHCGHGQKKSTACSTMTVFAGLRTTCSAGTQLIFTACFSSSDMMVHDVACT